MEPAPDAQPYQEQEQAVSKQQMTDFFQRLRRSAGLTAVMDFSCCSACGMYEVDVVRTPTDIGYVFYNWQSALKIQDSGEVKLSYGSYPEFGAHTLQQIGQIVAREADQMGIPFEWDGDGSKPIKLINLDKSDFQKHFDIVMEYSRNHFGGERTAVVRTEGGYTFPYSFTDKELNHTCGNGRFPCGAHPDEPCLHMPPDVAAGIFAPGH